MDPGPAFHFNAEPEPASQNNADPCRSASATLVRFCVFKFFALLYFEKVFNMKKLSVSTRQRITAHVFIAFYMATARKGLPNFLQSEYHTYIVACKDKIKTLPVPVSVHKTFWQFVLGLRWSLAGTIHILVSVAGSQVKRDLFYVAVSR
jgi:hypothetical protein